MKKQQINGRSRRHFLGQSAAYMAMASVLPLGYACSGGTPESKTAVASSGKGADANVAGPKVGVSTYSWRDMPGGLENSVKYCKEVGISDIEVLGIDMEIFMGKPEVPFADKYPYIKTFGPRVLAYLNIKVPAEEQKLFDEYEKNLQEWRMGLQMSDMEKSFQFLKEHGIRAHAGNPSFTGDNDEGIEYGFKMTKALGAEVLISEVDYENVKRLVPFAEKYDLKLALHNHKQFAEEGFNLDAILGLSPRVMLNFDVGNYFGSTGKHPNEILKNYHERIYSLHIKDMTSPTTDPPNTNQVWGQGETPIIDVLTLVKQEQWPLYCDIELEYDIKPWSDSVKETIKCANYARQILNG